MTDDVFVPVRSIAVDDQELIDQVIQIPGVMVNTTSAREYPYGQTLAHLTGYVQAISAEAVSYTHLAGVWRSKLFVYGQVIAARRCAPDKG